jgi:chromosome segregation ATPase
MTLDFTKPGGRGALLEQFMALFGGRASMLEVQNRALIKTAGERAQRISELERELQRAVQEVERLKAEAKRLKAEVERPKAEVERLKAEVERLKLEREFYYNRVLALEQHNREVTESATKYSLWGQSLERELAKIDPAGARARGFGERELHPLKAELEPLKAELERLEREREFYYNRVLALEQHNREVTESATRYSLWGQKLEHELARIDPDGAPARRFGARDDA